MKYDRLFSLIEDDLKLKSLITNLSSGYLDIPFIFKETLNLLDDDNSKMYSVSDANMTHLCIMMQQYFTDCWPLYVDDLGLDKLLEYGKIEIYKVDASEGLRYATTNEIAQGIKGLLNEFTYPIGEETYKKLCLLNWTFTGISYYFRQAGYELKYNEKGKVITTFYEMILVSAKDLKELFEWVSVKDNIKDAIKTLKKMKKSKGYKYASFAKDEITEDVPIKQLVMNICNTFPRNSTELDYRKALAISLKSSKSKKQLKPMEVSFLRKVYDEHALDINRSKKTEEVNDDLKQKCELLIKERYNGKINHNHFAYKIIDTLKKGSYTKCSPKQYSIIEDALHIIGEDTDENKDTQVTEIISENDIDKSLEQMSDAIGMGLFDEEDE